jgi:hypothetical protein
MKNDILIAMSGATTGKLAFSDTDEKAYLKFKFALSLFKFFNLLDK